MHKLMTNGVGGRVMGRGGRESAITRICPICQAQPIGRRGRSYCDSCQSKMNYVWDWFEAHGKQGERPRSLTARMASEKTCSTCGVSHSFRFFTVDPTSDDALGTVCRNCSPRPVKRRAAPSGPRKARKRRVMELPSVIGAAPVQTELTETSMPFSAWISAQGQLFNPATASGIDMRDSAELRVAAGPMVLTFDGAARDAIQAMVRGLQPQALLDELERTKADLAAAVELLNQFDVTAGAKLQDALVALAAKQAQVDALTAEREALLAEKAQPQASEVTARLARYEETITGQAQTINELRDQLERANAVLDVRARDWNDPARLSKQLAELISPTRKV